MAIRNLFSKNSLKKFENFLDLGPLLVFDFDGTLTPLNANYTKVKARRTTRALLEKIMALGWEVLVLTGREKRDAENLLKMPDIRVIGNHGNEGLVLHRRPVQHHKVRQWVKTLEREFATLKGVHVENKKLSLSVHYRQAKKPHRAHAEILKKTRKLKPAVKVIEGKAVVNILPHDAESKGSALKKLMKQLKAKHVVYVGDDVTDESVFALNRKLIFGIRVDRGEKTKAAFRVSDQKEVDRLLKLIVSHSH